MAKPRYNTDGPWLKGNTHIHSTFSDGGLTYVELHERYAGAGYDFLFHTDHNHVSRASSEAGLELLALDGVEIDGGDGVAVEYHVVALGYSGELPQEASLAEKLRLLRKGGALLVLAHPQWCGNSVEEALRYGFDGVEVYNDLCRWLNGKGEGAYFWDRMLCGNQRTLGFAADDTHLNERHRSWNGGWIMVNAAELTREAVMAAIRRGDFYSSCGPEIHSIHTSETEVRLTTSPARTVRLVGSTSHHQADVASEEAGKSEWVLELPRDWPYIRLEIEDLQGRRAWTNTLLLPD